MEKMELSPTMAICVSILQFIFVFEEIKEVGISSNLHSVSIPKFSKLTYWGGGNVFGENPQFA